MKTLEDMELCSGCKEEGWIGDTCCDKEPFRVSAIEDIKFLEVQGRSLLMKLEKIFRDMGAEELKEEHREVIEEFVYLNSIYIKEKFNIKESDLK